MILSEGETGDKRADAADSQRPPEDDTRDSGWTAVPCESDGAEGEDDTAGSEDVEWWKGEDHPNRGNEENSNEERCKCRSSGC